MGDNFYRRFPGDYQRDTRHLSLSEHGAYSLLLDSYYSTGRPLPESIESLARIVGCQNKTEREAVMVVADEFFPVADDGLRHNARADREIKERKEYSDAQAMRAHMRWHSNGNAGGYAGSMPPSPSPSPALKKNPPTPPVPGGMAFDEFWNSYPKKVGKEAARKAWGKHARNGAGKLIAAALSWQRTSEQWTRDAGQYIPNPATYLNQHRWEDEPEIPARVAQEIRKPKVLTEEEQREIKKWVG